MILPRLQVLTMNIHKGFNPLNRCSILPELREAVRSVDTDLVLLQRVLGSRSLHAAHLPSWSPAPQYEYLADSIWPQFAYGRNAVYPEGHHGNVVFSKYPILAHRNLDVSVVGSGERDLLHTVIGISRSLHAVCMRLGLRETQHQHQLQLLCELMTGPPEREPIVVADDFNDWCQRADRLLADCDLREVFVGAQDRPAHSFLVRWPMLSLNRIYLCNTRGCQPRILSQRPWSHLSDHPPLAVGVGP